MPDLKLHNPQAHASQSQLRQKLKLSRVYVDLTREMMTMAFNGRKGADLEALLVLLCIFVGEADGRKTTASNLSAHSGLSRTSVYRRLEYLIRAGKILREGRNYCLAEGAVIVDTKGRLSRILNNYWRA